MNIFLLGNGFDLHHNLPTNYIDFLDTVDFLSRRISYDSCSTVGEVFGNPKLTESNKTIENCNEKYKSVYESVMVSSDNIRQLVDLANKNDWFKYMLECYRKNATWIDFEQEISHVCDLFKEYFNTNRKYKKLNVKKECEASFLCFNSIFTTELDYSRYSGFYDRIILREQFVKKDEHNHAVLNESLIIETLYNSLKELSEMLSLYLRLFVDNTIYDLLNNNLIKRNYIFDDVDQVFTLNYTNTFAKVYGNAFNNTLHIHGNIDSEIVLGIQADKNDELKENDTTFIPFKKYFQRSIYETEYLLNKKIYDLKQSKDTINLSIMGHSLDITDRDIIKKLFDIADRITIYYYGDKKAQGNCIKKLIHIFGQEKYDEVATRALLRYLPLPT